VRVGPSSTNNVPSGSASADFAAAPDVVGSSPAAPQHEQKTSDQKVLPIPDSTTPTLTAASIVPPSQSGISLFGKLPIPASVLVTASGSFVFGQPSTTSIAFGPPPPSTSGPSTAGPSSAQPTVSGSDSTSKQTPAISTSSAAVGEDVSAHSSAFTIQPSLGNTSAEAAVTTKTGEEVKIVTSVVDTLSQTVASATPSTAADCSMITPSTAPATAIFGQPSTASTDTGTTSISAPSPVTTSGQPPTSVSTSVATPTTTPAVFSQPSVTATSSATGTTLFSSQTSTSVTSSAPSPFGAPASTSSSGMTLFGQQPASSSSLFGQPASTLSSTTSTSGSRLVITYINCKKLEFYNIV